MSNKIKPEDLDRAIEWWANKDNRPRRARPKKVIKPRGETYMESYYARLASSRQKGDKDV